MTSTEASSSEEKAATLRALHVPGDPLVLPNAWDAASARMVEAAGFPVVATSSFATARILGYDDGEAAPVEDVLAAAARIVRAVSFSRGRSRGGQRRVAGRCGRASHCLDGADRQVRRGSRGSSLSTMTSALSARRKQVT
jgi:Phosphoenolpyruvate phosphomutase